MPTTCDVSAIPNVSLEALRFREFFDEVRTSDGDAVITAVDPWTVIQVAIAVAGFGKGMLDAWSRNEWQDEVSQKLALVLVALQDIQNRLDALLAISIENPAKTNRDRDIASIAEEHRNFNAILQSDEYKDVPDGVIPNYTEDHRRRLWASFELNRQATGRLLQHELFGFSSYVSVYSGSCLCHVLGKHLGIDGGEMAGRRQQHMQFLKDAIDATESMKFGSYAQQLRDTEQRVAPLREWVARFPKQGGIGYVSENRRAPAGGQVVPPTRVVYKGGGGRGIITPMPKPNIKVYNGYFDILGNIEEDFAPSEIYYSNSDVVLHEKYQEAKDRITFAPETWPYERRTMVWDFFNEQWQRYLPGRSRLRELRAHTEAVSKLMNGLEEIGGKYKPR